MYVFYIPSYSSFNLFDEKVYIHLSGGCMHKSHQSPWLTLPLVCSMLHEWHTVLSAFNNRLPMVAWLYQALLNARAIQLARIPLLGLLRPLMVWPLRAWPGVQGAGETRLQHGQRYSLSLLLKENIGENFRTQEFHKKWFIFKGKT